MDLQDKRIGFALTGSFCTFARVFPQMQHLVDAGAQVIPIFSFNTNALDTRFFSAEAVREAVRGITGREPLNTLQGVEPIGPGRMLDLLIIAPCTGNTLAKLSIGLADTPVTLAAKSHLRNSGPVLVAVSTNDGLAVAARNIGELLSRRHYFFVPFEQDDWAGKPRSVVADMEKIPESARLALSGKQIQPILCRE